MFYVQMTFYALFFIGIAGIFEYQSWGIWVLGIGLIGMCTFDLPYGNEVRHYLWGQLKKGLSAFLNLFGLKNK